tara:strand:+ start:5529 stop:6296 length:768 start_codon:yes stop_codon:yes gene_type:complete
MRIISKHSDYYDGVRAYGADPKLVYVRKLEVINPTWQTPLPDEIRQNVPLGFAKIPTLEYRPFGSLRSVRTGYVSIGFCGKLYTVLEWRGKYYHHPEDILKAMLKRETIHTPDGRSFTNEPAIPKEHANTVRRQKFRGDNYHFPFNTKGWEHWCERYQGKVIGDAPFILLGAPVYSYENPGGGYNRTFTINPTLKEFGFPRLVDPWTAWQELSMYIGNNLAQELQGMDQICDEDMAAMKGFGHKYAFRKEPTKRR